ncbi:hypothetical protein Hanom_Chr06g00560841 [Helianthus anomalus]
MYISINRSDNMQHNRTSPFGLYTCTRIDGSPSDGFGPSSLSRLTHGGVVTIPHFYQKSQHTNPTCSHLSLEAGDPPTPRSFCLGRSHSSSIG